MRTEHTFVIGAASELRGGFLRIKLVEPHTILPNITKNMPIQIYRKNSPPKN